MVASLILLVLAVGAGIVGVLFFFSEATGAVHEIEGLVCFLGAAVFLAGSAIVGEIARLRAIFSQKTKLPT